MSILDELEMINVHVVQDELKKKISDTLMEYATQPILSLTLDIGT